MTVRRLSTALAGPALAALLCGASPVAAEAPHRVVSMNLCTDQLAMMLAAPGQLHSVTYIAADPRSSAMAEQAKEHVINHGLAEEIFLMQPDLVIAGAYSTRATVAMLRRLDIPVVVFDPASSLEDVRDRILQMGEVLHREDTAQAMASDFDTRLANLRADVAQRPRAVLYYANGYTSGEQTLAGQILTTAGFANAAAEAGYGSGMKVPLEVLAVTNPDLVITSQPYPGESRAEAIMSHPVIETLRRTGERASITDRDWVCGTPFVLRAIEELAADRDALFGDRQ
ncbi:corrinoid ABC transporter substrate-binding protein [Roseovarius sp. THAF27]|uniref:ABC transporter substrate-binding protein n=1 Tax=Roseovarius sp. THAF27 TaxID=2587850 RepID=UPI001267F466|nr:ABC transporter substrate-binding protein [Roseovarius sp. THAF27]QFT82370.1 corrinoid ABC transporter substrate-binding protein [Roseovarius sp. THAF27]